MSAEPLRLGDLVLPSALADALRAGLWTPPTESSRLVEVFGEAPSSPEFYVFSGMVNETLHLRKMPPDERVWYEEVADVEEAGSISLDECILIGDLGPERPFALNYHRNRSNPEVFFFARPGWKRIAADFDKLLQSLGLVGE